MTTTTTFTTITSCGTGVQGQSDALIGGLSPNVAEQIAIQFLRARWMRAMGATQQDIDEYCDLKMHPGSITDELENLRDLESLHLNNLSRTDLENLSKRFSNPPGQ